MKKILIIGGQLFNKGAQAMTFTVIDEIRRRDLKQEIVLLSDLDFKRPESEKSKYNFMILPYNEQIKFLLLGGFYKLLYLINRLAGRGGDASYTDQVKSMFLEADYILDISGYGITRQWPWRRSMLYLMNIILAKKYDIPICLLPQSFGPFEYKNKLAKWLLYHTMKKYLPYPKVIFAREEEGYRDLLSFTGANLKKSMDIVLLREKEIDINHIFVDSTAIKSKDLKINEGSIAIIPNEKVMKHGDLDKIHETYIEIVNLLREENKSVYLLAHSSEDNKICGEIKESFLFDDKVVLVNDEMYCFELEALLSRFDFVVASRYHSIIHSYKKGTPVIALGWATKYEELLKQFKQFDFFFDVRKDLDAERILKATKYMISNCKEEKEMINRIRKEKTDNDVFDRIFEENI